MACSVAGTLLLCSPQSLLGGHGSVLQNPSASLRARSPRLVTAFRSPTATALFRKPPRQGHRSRPIPSTHFRAFPPTRSALNSHPRFRFSRSRGCSSLKARCRTPNPELPNFRQPLLPFRTFVLPDRSAQSTAESEKLAFASSPISLRSPLAFTSVISSSPTDHRSRSATVRQAYCSLNLLEPSTSSPETLFPSTVKCMLQRLFLVLFQQ